jgi:hypothetical protein
MPPQYTAFCQISNMPQKVASQKRAIFQVSAVAVAPVLFP